MGTIQYLPSLGMTGTYALKNPYNTLIMSTTQYTCVKLQSLSAAVAAKEDPYTNVYLSNGATQADYDADLAAQAYLITIQSGTGDLVVFPSSALVSVPSTEGVICRNLVMSISLSVLPDGTDLSSLTQQIEDLVLNTLGVKSTIYLPQRGAVTILTQDHLSALNSARQVNLQTMESPLYRNMQLEAQNAQLLAKVQTLSDFIATNITKITS
jgi:hypothetical protein